MKKLKTAQHIGRHVNPHVRLTSRYSCRSHHSQAVLQHGVSVHVCVCVCARRHITKNESQSLSSWFCLQGKAEQSLGVIKFENHFKHLADVIYLYFVK